MPVKINNLYMEVNRIILHKAHLQQELQVLEIRI